MDELKRDFAQMIHECIQGIESIMPDMEIVSTSTSNPLQTLVRIRPKEGGPRYFLVQVSEKL